jgi:hypothetical protein
MAKKKPAKARKPKTKSRMFEELIARIEKTLLPEGATVKSPDRIPDKITGRLREVDAAIRYQVGSVPILITVECRRRSKVDDATWIEQLATKQKDVGAARTIAVSWKGFGEPAKQKAAFYGIEIRRVEDITTEEIENWKNKFGVVVEYVEHQLKRALVQFKPPMPDLQMAEPSFQGLMNDPFGTKFIFTKADGQGMSLADVLAEYAKDNGPIDKGMKVGEVCTKDFQLDFLNNAYYCSTKQGNKDIEFLYVELIVMVKAKEVPFQKLSRYSSDSRVFSHVADGVIELAGGQQIQMIVSNPPTDGPEMEKAGAIQPQPQQK